MTGTHPLDLFDLDDLVGDEGDPEEEPDEEPEGEPMEAEG